MLSKSKRCIQCTQLMDQGILLGGRWLHVTCIEPYISNAERQRDEALAAAAVLREERAKMVATVVSGYYPLYTSVGTWQPLADGGMVTYPATTSAPTSDFTTSTTTSQTSNDSIRFEYKLKLAEVSDGP
jgi:hypothetical protein